MKTSKHTQNKHTQMACMHTECPTMPVIHPTNFHGTSHEPIRLCYFCFKNFEYYECPTDSNYVLIHITSPTSYRGWTLRLVFSQNCNNFLRVHFNKMANVCQVRGHWCTNQLFLSLLPLNHAQAPQFLLLFNQCIIPEHFLSFFVIL